MKKLLSISAVAALVLANFVVVTPAHAVKGMGEEGGAIDPKVCLQGEPYFTVEGEWVCRITSGSGGGLVKKGGAAAAGKPAAVDTHKFPKKKNARVAGSGGTGGRTNLCAAPATECDDTPHNGFIADKAVLGSGALR